MSAEATPNNPPTPAGAQNVVWHDIVERVDAYASDLELGVPVRPETYLHDNDPAWVRTTLLTELAKVEMAHKRERGERYAAEAYLDTFPELTDDDASLSLIYEEYQLRRNAGEAVTRNEFERRFPRRAAELSRLIDADPEPKSTSILRRARPRKTDELEFDDFERIVALGKGAFGDVYLARQRSMERLVALKVTRDVTDESRTLAQLDHLNIVRVFDQRRSEAHRVWLMYMEFLPGGTLSHVRARQKSIPRAEWSGALLFDSIDASMLHAGQQPLQTESRRRLSAESWAQTVCRIGADMARALDYAHTQKTLHRDVKPGNILLTAEGVPKLADFNTSFCSSVDGARPDIFFGGTLPYMAPEQIRVCSSRHSETADDLDGRADLYSLGVVMWAMLFGERPFGDDEATQQAPENLEAMIERRRTPPALPPGEHDTMTLAIVEVLQSVLAFARKDRPRTGEDLAYRLQLARDPAARAVLEAPDRPFGKRVMGAPFFFLTLAVVTPNLLGSLLNILYNTATLESVFAGTAGARDVFDTTVAVVNGTFFPLGILYVRQKLRPLWRALLGKEGGRTPESMAALSAAALRVGHYGATVSLALWLVAGVAFPVALMVTIDDAPRWVYLHFIVSIGFCGLMSASYPYFAAGLLVNRSLLPWLWRRALTLNIPFNPQAEIRRQRVMSQRYLAMAAGAPLLAMLVLAPTALWWRAAEPDKVALLAVIVVGVVGLFLSFSAYRRLHADWDAMMSGRTGAQQREA